jgi:hypothetical protein
MSPHDPRPFANPTVEESNMTAVDYQEPEEQWEDDEQETLDLPSRPRRQWFNRRSAALLAVVVGAIGFYAGIRIEKSQLSGSSAVGGTGLPSFAAAGAGGRAPSAAGGRGGPPAGLGQFAAGGNGSAGTVTSVSGHTIYVRDITGNTIAVKLSSATSITKSLKVSKAAVRPGDSVVVQGLRHGNGTFTASSLNDSGASTTGAGSGSSGTSSSASSGVNSLFGSGSGG